MNPPVPSNTPANNQQVIDDIDNFISGLKAPLSAAPIAATPTISPNDPPLKIEVPQTDEEMKTFVLKHSAELVENSVKSILELQKITVATGDPEMMAGLASLIAASTNAIETVNKIHLQNQKAENAKELKKLDIEGRKEVQKIKNEGNSLLPGGQTNILIATREEIIAQLTGKAKAAPVEDVYTIESSPLSS
jgi:hypothetical protein